MQLQNLLQIPSTTCIFHDSFLESTRFLAYALHTLTSIEIPLHIFGAYLIIFKTPPTMRTAKYSILQLHLVCTMMDLMVTSMWSFYWWIPTPAGFPVGLMTSVGVDAGVQAFLACNSMSAVAISYISFFENRYDVLVIGSFGRSKFRNIGRVIYFSLLSTYMESVLIYIFTRLPDIEESREFTKNQQPCIPLALINNANFVSLNMTSMDIPTLTTIMFIIISSQEFYFILYTTYYLFKDNSHISKSTRRMQRRFFACLIIQAAIPVTSILLPFFGYFLLWRFALFYQAYNNLLMIAIGCNGLFTTLVMIMVHHPYRNAVMEMCKVRKVEKPNSIGGATFLNLRPLAVVSGG